jgi:hypothetical protein
MKTVPCAGGAVALDDDAAAALLDYSEALAHLRLTGTVTIVGHTAEDSTAPAVLAVGLGAALTIEDDPAGSDADDHDSTGPSRSALDPE